ncbi:hypothetical protein DL96DRAFT_1770052 [Flagelloscypha sp. PMI_526]|nr:hypothetical protein DL96DRAFT_1770052 [Flagelloscypha sp. PMI_526]
MSTKSARTSSSIRSSSSRATSSYGAEPASPRTLGGIREQVAKEVALRTIMKSKTCADVKIGVSFLYAQENEDDYLKLVASCIAGQSRLSHYCYALVSTNEAKPPIDSGPSTTSVVEGSGGVAPLIVLSSNPEYITRAILLTSTKFLGRIDSAYTDDDGTRWFARVRGIGKHTLYDDEALWDVVKKCVEPPMEPLLPPPGSKGIDQILSEARAKLQRITPLQAYEELRETQVNAPTFLVDIRPVEQRKAEGGIQGALMIERNVLEWRFDPRCEARLPIVDRYDLRVIVFCQEGYTSSLAALALHQLGLLNATDVIGGYDAWRKAGRGSSFFRFLSRLD